MKKTLFIGLGNPGEEYADTYHNVGWMALDFFKAELQKKYGSSEMQKGKNFRFEKYGDIYLAYPDTFMNESGKAVENALKWFDKKPEEAVIFHDDSDLAIGEYREASGGAAGHHGIESILKTLQDAPILRVRIGIRDPREKAGDEPRRKAGDFVLKKIKDEDLKELEEKVFSRLTTLL